MNANNLAREDLGGKAKTRKFWESEQLERLVYSGLTLFNLNLYTIHFEQKHWARGKSEPEMN